MDRIIYQKIQEIISNRQKAALCIVTDAKGSTPRKARSKMLVYNDQKIVGTIGGGNIEHQVIQKALEIIKKGIPQTVSFMLKKDLQMACGGSMQVYIEPIKLPDQLIIFGGGHISKAICNFTEHLDFQTIVIDERKNIFDNWHKNENITFLNELYTTAINKLIFDSQTYIVSATYAHTHDRDIAALCVTKTKAYLGIVASKNKAKTIAEYLQKEKNISQQDIELIDMPCGIPINCETPEEIAISILAKIIDLRNKKIKKIEL